MKTKGGGSRKGSAYERLTATRLSLWVSGGSRRDIFWRSSGSGSRATRDRRVRKTQSGDISAVAPEGANLVSLFCIECKRYHNLHFGRLLNGKSTGFLSMWQKLVHEAARAGKRPMMICREDFGIDLLVTDRVGSQMLAVAALIGDRRKQVLEAVAVMGLGMAFYRLDDVLTMVDPGNLKLPRRRLHEASNYQRFTPDGPHR